MYPTADDAPSAARQAACRCVTVRAAPHRARAVITGTGTQTHPGTAAAPGTCRVLFRKPLSPQVNVSLVSVGSLSSSCESVKVVSL